MRGKETGGAGFFLFVFSFSEYREKKRLGGWWLLIVSGETGSGEEIIAGFGHCIRG
jgi:hypothetical protein